jgi:regulator of protease activity HflC (stomatin/prohibitin superfamily)
MLRPLVLACSLLFSPLVRADIVGDFVNKLPAETRTEFFIDAEKDFQFPIAENGGSMGPGKHIDAGYVGLARFNDKFVFIGPGYTWFANPSKKWVSENPRPNDSSFRTKEKVPVSQKLIEHGNWTIVRVESGELGYMQDVGAGKPMFLLPGSHKFEDAQKRFVAFLKFDQPEVKAGSFTFQKINAGQKGVLDESDGNLRLLEPGLHMIKSPNKIKAIISTRQEQISLERKLHYTEDDVGLMVEASLFYHIENPLLAFQRAFDSNDDVVKTLREQAKATLTNVVRRQQFAHMGKGEGEQAKTLSEAIDYEKFLESTTSAFAKEFQERFGAPNGIVIESLVITSFNFEDKSMQDNITKNAMLYAKNKAELENIDATAKISQLRAEKDRQVKLTEAGTEREVAEQKALATKILNQSEADKILMIAKAKSDAAKLEADAEAYRQEKLAHATARLIEILGSTAFGQQYLLAKLQADALSKSKMVLMERIPQLLRMGALQKEAAAEESEEGESADKA